MFAGSTTPHPAGNGASWRVTRLNRREALRPGQALVCTCKLHGWSHARHTLEPSLRVFSRSQSEARPQDRGWALHSRVGSIQRYEIPPAICPELRMEQRTSDSAAAAARTGRPIPRQGPRSERRTAGPHCRVEAKGSMRRGRCAGAIAPGPLRRGDSALNPNPDSARPVDPSVRSRSSRAARTTPW